MVVTKLIKTQIYSRLSKQPVSKSYRLLLFWDTHSRKADLHFPYASFQLKATPKGKDPFRKDFFLFDAHRSHKTCPICNNDIKQEGAPVRCNTEILKEKRASEQYRYNYAYMYNGAKYLSGVCLMSNHGFGVTIVHIRYLVLWDHRIYLQLYLN